MFFHLVMPAEVELHPRHFGPTMRATLEQKLTREVEGTCSGKYGFVVAVTSIIDVSQGAIREGTGFAKFDVKYSCVVFRPFKGEVLDTVVTQVNKMGFFAEAGPVQIFVSNHLIPEEFEFSALDDPCYVSQDEEVRVIAGSEVRLRIVGIRVDPTEIFCVGTIRDDFLAVIGDQA
jgi:DNA-directed RNA polymerase II subunit RPB7